MRVREAVWGPESSRVLLAWSPGTGPLPGQRRSPFRPAALARLPKYAPKASARAPQASEVSLLLRGPLRSEGCSSRAKDRTVNFREAQRRASPWFAGSEPAKNQSATPSTNVGQCMAKRRRRPRARRMRNKYCSSNDARPLKRGMGRGSDKSNAATFLRDLAKKT